MNILYVAHGGFGDVAMTTAWPRIWSEKGHVVDIFLLRFTGNPFYKNPYVRDTFVVSYPKVSEEITNVLNGHKYDKIIIIENSETGFGLVIPKIRGLENALIVNSQDLRKEDCLVPWYSKPELYYSDQESKYITENGLENSIVFHPLSSSFTENSEYSRNIPFSVIEGCSKIMENVVMTGGCHTADGKFFVPDDIAKIRGPRLMWEGCNCFNDDTGSVLGKTFALVSKCKVSVHAFSGSNIIPMCYDKPMIIVAPDEKMKMGSGPLHDTEKLFYVQRNYFLSIHLKAPDAWCITRKASDILDAVNLVLSGKSGFFHKTWKSF